jgi:Domain of unknown function (DUF4214)
MSVANDQIVQHIFESLLHREPTQGELTRESHRLATGVSPIVEAEKVFRSTEYQAVHRSATAFVEGLYHDVLGHGADVSGEQFWIREVSSGQMSRTAVAEKFLTTRGSFLGTNSAGVVTNVSVTNGWASAIRGNVASATGFFNAGNPPTVVTITVSGPGQYVLDQSQTNGSYIGNNSGKSWKGFTLTILSNSSALPTFTSSVDVTGHFPTVNRQNKSVNFSGGIVKSGFNSQINGFQPKTTINATSAGTIVVQETPVNA